MLFSLSLSIFLPLFLVSVSFLDVTFFCSSCKPKNEKRITFLTSISFVVTVFPADDVAVLFSLSFLLHFFYTLSDCVIVNYAMWVSTDDLWNHSLTTLSLWRLSWFHPNSSSFFFAFVFCFVGIFFPQCHRFMLHERFRLRVRMSANSWCD